MISQIYLSLQQQLTSAKKQSDANISHLNEEIKSLSIRSLGEKEATAAQLQSELQTYQQGNSTPEQLLELSTQIAKLEHRLQEAECQKQQAELEREAIVQEIKAKQKLHAQLGKLTVSYFIAPSHLLPSTTAIVLCR